LTIGQADLQIDDSPPLSEAKPEPNAAGLMPGDEVINSDLDDSEGELDDDGEGDDEADVDIVFCVYDKVSLMSPILTSADRPGTKS
jgi:hypothetical protein